jgi:hypothetical protein
VVYCEMFCWQSSVEKSQNEGHEVDVRKSMSIQCKVKTVLVQNMNEGGVVSLILNFETRWKRVVSFTRPAALFLRERAFGTYVIGAERCGL